VRTVRLLSFAVITAVAAVGCQSGATNPLGVEGPDLTPLSVAPSYARLNDGEALRLVASLQLPNGSRSSPEDVKWSSADKTVASIEPDGTVHALRAGRVQIIAEWHESRGSSLIVVAEQVSKKGDPPVHLE
jgi:hypothetical protein